MKQSSASRSSDAVLLLLLLLSYFKTRPGHHYLGTPFGAPSLPPTLNFGITILPRGPLSLESPPAPGIHSRQSNVTTSLGSTIHYPEVVLRALHYHTHTVHGGSHFRDYFSLSAWLLVRRHLEADDAS